MIDYPRLLMQRWDQAAGNRAELKVFGPNPIVRVTEAMIGPDGFLGPDINARINFQASKDVYVARGGTLPRRRPAPEIREIARGDVIEGRGWRMLVGDATHHQPLLNCLTYRLETPAGSLVYSGDSGSVPEDFIALARDCDLLIHMCHFPSGIEPTAEFRRSTGSHMDIAEIARRANVKALVLSHMTPLVDRPGVKERMIAEIARVYSGPVILGEDLMEIPFRVTYPERID
jgi:ribonuclease BN (tRNA processing enzyme)